ncbi:hypothetical protein V1498_06900 [Peribacillus sp. SCS-26]|uniref:hypothetical protein n=1 Tax=Paraperibacillus marinus TaxID=3115295 RepID=UPI003905D572
MERKEVSFETIEEELYLNEGYADLLSQFERDKSIVSKLEELLSHLKAEENYPFFLIDLAETIFPRFIGSKAANFVVHILAKGFDQADLSKDFDFQLYVMVKKFGILFVSAMKYVNNQMDFSTSQYIGTNEQDRTMIRLIRSDQSTLVFNLDQDSLTHMIARLSYHLLSSIQFSSKRPSEEKFDELMYNHYSLMIEMGILEPAELDEDEDEEDEEDER